MDSQEKELFDITDSQFENEYMVKDITRFDHWLLFGIGIIPFVIASIWYAITF